MWSACRRCSRLTRRRRSSLGFLTQVLARLIASFTRTAGPSEESDPDQFSHFPVSLGARPKEDDASDSFVAPY
jgi:hypothetical protein